MKKIIIISFLSMLILTPGIASHATINYYEPAEESQEELLMDMFYSLLLPNVQEAVSHYYSDYFTTTPLVYPYEMKIVSMERTDVYRSYMFELIVEVTPVVGPHIEVGKDQLTVLISAGNGVSLKEFQHLETYELPSNLQNIVKEKETF